MENTLVSKALSPRNPTRTAVVSFSLVIIAALSVFLLLKNAGRLDHVIGSHSAAHYTPVLPSHFNVSDAYAQTSVNSTPMLNNNWMNGIRGY